ncbi:MAG: transcription antitermination factor NusB [Patescibacteria group bacterium]
MANRHLSRSIVLQSLYEWDFGHKSQDEALDVFKRNAEEFAPGMSDFAFMDKLLRGVLGKQPELDQIIEKAAPDWPIDKISAIDRNILRVGLYELLFSDRKEVPAKVAINEAIELAKNYGSDTSSRFVNGVLGAVYKEIGEPGKNETSKRKTKDIPDKDLPIEELSGAVVFARDGEDVYLALIHDIFGHWTLTKGKLQPGEDLEQGTIRNVKDELGLDIKIVEKLDENTYVAFNPETGKKKKHVTYYLTESGFTDIKLEQKGGLDDGKWFKLKDILELNFYNDILPIVTKAINSILSQK